MQILKRYWPLGASLAATAFILAIVVSLAPAKAAGWTGCYAGVHVGVNASNTEVSAGGASLVDGLGADGGLAGIHGGCD